MWGTGSSLSEPQRGDSRGGFILARKGGGGFRFSVRKCGMQKCWSSFLSPASVKPLRPRISLALHPGYRWPMSAARIRRLTLTNFRSYRAAQIEVAAGPIVLVGPNGAGKTNLIEAISFLAPGRGLRRATLDEVAFQEGNGSWAGSAEVAAALGLATLGTGI